MKKLFNDIFTGIDNQTYDLGRILWAASVVVFLLMSIGHMILSHIFSYVECAGGISAILASGAGSLAIKSKTEPKKEDKQNAINSN